MKISFKALALGYLITIAAGLLTSLLNLRFLSTGTLDSFFGSSMDAQAFLSYVFFGVTLLIDIIAGYFCAKIAKQEELLHGIVLGLIIWIFSTLVSYINYRRYDLDMPLVSIQTLLALVWPLLFCLLGAFIRKRINDKTREENEPGLEQKIKNIGNN